MANDYDVRVCRNAEEVAEAAADLFIEECGRAGRFRVALSGGSTPRHTYQLLAEPQYGSRVDWNKVELFWGDERYVPPEHPDSNYRMTREALLRHVALAPDHVHPMPTEISPPEAAAAAYERLVRQNFGTPHALPQFDLVFLGLGTNGHTASLFPHSPLLRETSRLVAADFVAEVNSWRLTLTAPVLNSGRMVAFLVAGAEKADVLQEVLYGHHDPQKLPAQLIRPRPGQLLWIVDQAAAAKLGPSERSSAA